mmetsp:Transcript_96718/g.250107  ORF Transcript_96718/g.250107 Transcript_96718/m.250107 type:complete len:347 (-) Transcript_96718:495-1535(-)
MFDRSDRCGVGEPAALPRHGRHGACGGRLRRPGDPGWHLLLDALRVSDTPPGHAGLRQWPCHCDCPRAMGPVPLRSWGRRLCRLEDHDWHVDDGSGVHGRRPHLSEDPCRWQGVAGASRWHHPRRYLERHHTPMVPFADLDRLRRCGDFHGRPQLHTDVQLPTGGGGLGRPSDVHAGRRDCGPHGARGHDRELPHAEADRSDHQHARLHEARVLWAGVRQPGRRSLRDPGRLRAAWSVPDQRGQRRTGPSVRLLHGRRPHVERALPLARGGPRAGGSARRPDVPGCDQDLRLGIARASAPHRHSGPARHHRRHGRDARRRPGHGGDCGTIPQHPRLCVVCRQRGED